MSGQISEGIAQIGAGMDEQKRISIRINLVEMQCTLAEAQVMAGQSEEGLATLTKALSWMGKPA